MSVLVDDQLNPLVPTLYNVPYPLLFPASRKPGAGPLGTRKLELARQQEGTALRGRRPTKAEITPAKHPTGAPDGRCLLALGMGLTGEILAEKTNSRAGGEGTNRAMTE